MDQYTSQTSRPKILIADDDPCVLRAVAERCNGMGFEVETAASGLQALNKASECHPDLIVIDVHMPEVDGLSVLSMLVEVAKKSRHVIVMTGRPGTGDRGVLLLVRRGLRAQGQHLLDRLRGSSAPDLSRAEEGYQAVGFRQPADGG